MRPPLLALVGPTASGKSDAGIVIARELGAEICSVDSMLVYRGMDIGTAKPGALQRAVVPHHLIDVAEPNERFTVARFQRLARDAIEELRVRDVAPLLVGGSGLYFRAVVDDLDFPGEDAAARAALRSEADVAGVDTLYRRLRALDPSAASKIEPANVRRIVRALEVPAITGRRFSEFADAWSRHDPSRVRVAGIDVPRPVLATRIEGRVSAMFAAGWVGEVRALLERGAGDWLTSTQAIGYSELARHLDGRLSLEEAWEGTVRRTKNLARRQTAWFRRDPRVRWFEGGRGRRARCRRRPRGVPGRAMTEPLEFAKYQGAGNDFVMLLDLDDSRPIDPPEAAALCDRRAGVGADGVIRLVRTDRDGATFFMDYSNADGSEAEMCGNGIRCVGVMLHDRGLTAGATELDVLTRSGVRHLTLHLEDDGGAGLVTVAMGTPHFTRASIPMRGPAWETFLARPFDVGEGLTLTASAVSMGNPHLVVFVDGDPATVHVGHIGPVLERHELFPEHTNVEFAYVHDGVVHTRVWERGSGETMACGSGACAVAVAANEAGVAPPTVVVRFPGGDLQVERRDDGEVLLTGDAVRVFEGVVDLEALTAT